MDNNINDIVLQCCKINNISQSEFFSKSRLRQIVDARTMAFYFMRNVLDLTYTRIAKYFDKNHATIIHAVNKHDAMMDWDLRYKEKYQLMQYTMMDNYPEKFEGNIIYELRNENNDLKQRIIEIVESQNIENNESN